MSTIRSRRSIRKYKEGAEVTNEQVKLLLEAAMYAPSAANTRPWEFIVVRDRVKLDEIANVHPYAKMLKTASLAIIVCGLPDSQQGSLEGFFPQDCAAATQNILLEATELGIGSCWCGVYPNNGRVGELRAIFDLPQHVVPFNIIAIGIANEEPRANGFYEEEKVRYFE